MQQEAAETEALKALGWLAAQDALLPVFLGSTGATEADLRSRVADPAFLASVLDFLMLDDAWVIDWAAATGNRPEDLARFRAALPGGDLPNWT